MTQNPSTSAPPVDKVDIASDTDVDRWAKKFDVTEDQIRDAVTAVGDRADNVEMHLKGSRSTTNADQEARGDSGPAQGPARSQ